MFQYVQISHFGFFESPHLEGRVPQHKTATCCLRESCFVEKVEEAHENGPQDGQPYTHKSQKVDLIVSLLSANSTSVLRRSPFGTLYS